MRAHVLIFLLAMVVHVCVAGTKEKKKVNIMKPKPNAPTHTSSLGSPTSISGTMVYHGLPWGNFTGVYPIFWGPIQPNQQNIIQMYKDIAPSNFLPWNNQYYGSKSGGRYNTTNGTYNGSLSLPHAPITVSCPKHGHTCTPGLSQTWLETTVAAMFQNGTIQWIPNTYYPIHFDPNSFFGNGTFGSTWCAYHDFINVTINGNTYVVPFGVIPDNRNTSNCGSGFNGGMTLYISHEWQEVTSDPYWAYGGSGGGVLYGGWWDNSASEYESADKCAWDPCDGGSSLTPACKPAGVTTSYTIQQIWTPAIGCQCPIC